ncbi:ABC transporter ATP-binding protein [Pedobacter sp. GR22-6]|uniref:ABC transporter ATP-binding protein n=1 Tax=Pedobacter sp. GR22-6 TaxID=3127957 RepID=UPI00307EAE8F
MLTFNKFIKKYQETKVLDIHEMSLNKGIYWLKGANGSGKSTLLKSLAGILHFEGDVLLEKLVSVKKNKREYRRLVNFAEAEPVFPEFLTGKELIDMFAKAKSGTNEQKEFYTQTIGLQPYLNQPLGTYSSGMLKKLSLILAFMGKPKLILLDEPLITVDLTSLEVLYNWIIERNKSEDTSFVLASHQSLDGSGIPVDAILSINDKQLLLSE